MCECFLAAAPLLVGVAFGIAHGGLLLGVMHRAICLSANLAEFALLAAFGNNGLGSVLARLEFRPFRFLRRVGLLLPDFDVLVARDGLFAFGLLLVCRTDLDKLRFGGDLGLYVRVQFGGIAIRVSTLCGIWANCKSFLLARRRRVDRVTL